MATKAEKSTTKTSPTKKASKKKPAKKKVAKKKSAKKKTSTKKKTASGASKKKATHTSKVKRASSSTIDVNAEERWRMIAVAAYHKAEARNFAPGYETEDWLQAEKEVDALLQSKK